MTSPETAKYIQRFAAALKALPEREQNEAIAEIQSHIEDAVGAGEPEAEVLRRLGPATLLAQSFVGTHAASHHVGSLMTMVQAIGFYFTTGLTSMIVVPVLGTMAGGFLFSGALAIIAGFLRFFGADWVNMMVWDGVSVPRSFSILFGGGIGAIIALIGWGCWVLLKRYLSFVSRQYRARALAR